MWIYILVQSPFSLQAGNKQVGMRLDDTLGSFWFKSDQVILHSQILCTRDTCKVFLKEAAHKFFSVFQIF